MAILEDGRSRAWVLLRVRTPEEAANALYEQFGLAGGDDFVVVRADIVDHDYNIVVPVDAANDEVLSDVVCQIYKVTGGTELLVLKVQQHIPLIPHIADGYVSTEEYEAEPDESVKIGRQRTSPGANAWG